VVRLDDMKQPPPLAPSHLRFAVLATDVALFTIKGGELMVRVMNVNRAPQFINIPGLPGSIIHPEETAEVAAGRVIAERGGIDPKKIHLEQLYTFSDIDRDPRGRVVAVAYLGLTNFDSLTENEQAPTDSHYWLPVSKAKKLAYDHTAVLAMALTRLRSRLHYTTLISKLMPKTFTLTELESAFACVTGTTLDKRNFRKKVLKVGILEETGEKRADGAFRPAALYRFTSSKVRDIEVL
jgi:8-oxo-dGTP diphosphatase